MIYELRNSKPKINTIFENAGIKRAKILKVRMRNMMMNFSKIITFGDVLQNVDL